MSASRRLESIHPIVNIDNLAGKSIHDSRNTILVFRPSILFILTNSMESMDREATPETDRVVAENNPITCGWIWCRRRDIWSGRILWWSFLRFLATPASILSILFILNVSMDETVLTNGPNLPPEMS